MKSSDPPNSSCSRNDQPSPINSHGNNTLSSYNTNDSATIEYVNPDKSRRRSSPRSLDGSQAQDKADPEYSPAHGPSTLLSQRFHHESDSEHDLDDDQEDSDRTEGEQSPAAATTTARLKALNKRSTALGE
jgi:hypothetical protein